MTVDNYETRVPLGGGHLVVKIVLKLIEVPLHARRIAVDILEERPEVNEVMVQLLHMQLVMTNLFKINRYS